MTNLFVQDPVYISIENLRDSTTNEDIKADSPVVVTDEDLKILIWKAQDIIDAVIFVYWDKNSETQTTIFPIKNTDWSDNTEIPIDVQKATILLVENLYEWWVLDGWAYGVWSQWIIKSETSRWHTISYFSWWSSATDINEFLNDEILIYLRDYILNLSAQWYR